jgi:hypothetical protein
MVKPPWKLTGNGYIFIFNFPRQFVENYGFIPDYLKGKYRGGLGTVMLVDYHTSPVGPYQEALFVPGLFEHERRKLYSITKIYVSSIESVLDGQDNWGIPKELANFAITPLSNTVERFRMAHEQRTFIDVTLKSQSLQVPVNMRWLPVRPGLIQHYQGKDIITRPLGKGRVGLTKLEDSCVDPIGFPDFSQHKPLMAVRATNFTLEFPIPKIIRAQRGN